MLNLNKTEPHKANRYSQNEQIKAENRTQNLHDYQAAYVFFRGALLPAYPNNWQIIQKEAST